MIYRTKSN